ncbi:MAG: radical SAM protein [Candidatus Omnitrophota bacterium]
MTDNSLKLKKVKLPDDIDYIGVYLTNRCFLSCPYCITNYNERYINTKGLKELEPSEWIASLNRLILPEGIPLTLQGGEPFLYRGIWDILENIRHKADILTALPPEVTVEKFKKLKTLDWNKRVSPYPTIRVSYHHGQNDYKSLIDRIRELQGILSIGLFHIEHPAYPGLAEEIRAYAKERGVEFRTKAFLGEWQGKTCARYKYDDACKGKITRKKVRCRNTVYPIGPNGLIYRCHSDLYARRENLALGCITNPDLKLDHQHTDCYNYGTCSPCDIKVKTNHLQEDGYTSVDIIF